MTYQQVAEPRGRRCPLSSCIEIERGEKQETRFISAPGWRPAIPWITEQVVEVRRPEIQERIIEVPQIAKREQIVESKKIIAEKVKYVPRYDTVERVLHIPKDVIQEVYTEVPQVQVIERTVDVPTPIYQDVVIPVAKPVIEERVTHIPKPITVEKVVEVPRVVYRPYPVDRIVEVPQTKVEYRHKAVVVSPKVIRPVVLPPSQGYTTVKKTITELPATSWRQKSSPLPTSSAPPDCPLAAWCSPASPRASTQGLHVSQQTPPRWHSSPVREEVVWQQEVEQPFVVEGVEEAADSAGCCPLTPRKQVKRGELTFTSRDNSSKPINVKVAKLPARKTERRPCASKSEAKLIKLRADSAQPAMRTVKVVPYNKPPPFEPVPIPMYQWQQQTFEQQQQQQQIQVQQQQQQLAGASEPWIRTRVGDMPFSEFERMNNENSLASSPRGPGPSATLYTGEQQQQQQQQVATEENKGVQEDQTEQQKKHLWLQQQQQEEARQMYEQQEQQRLQQHKLWEQQRKELEAQRQQEWQQLQQQLQQQREQQERELQQKMKEEELRREEERQKWLAQVKKENERKATLQREQHQKQLEQLMQLQKRQRQEQEERKQRFMQEQQKVMAQLLQQQQQQQQQLQQELDQHHMRMQQQQQLLKAQQDQAFRQLQAEHQTQQQRLAADAQRRAEVPPLQPPIGSTHAGQPSFVMQEGQSEVLIETRFGLMPYSVFQTLNQANTLKGVEPSAYQPSICCIPTPVWQTQAPVATTVYAKPASPVAQNVVYYHSYPAYPIQHQRIQKQHYYKHPAQQYRTRGPEDQGLLPREEEAGNIQAEAHRIGKEAVVAGSQVYGGVRKAMNSEVTQGIFRSVGELVSGAYQRLGQGRQ